MNLWKVGKNEQIFIPIEMLDKYLRHCSVKNSVGEPVFFFHQLSAPSKKAPLLRAFW